MVITSLDIYIFYESEKWFCWRSCINSQSFCGGGVRLFHGYMRALQKKWKRKASPWKVWILPTIDSILNIWNSISNDSCIGVNTSNIQKYIKLNHVIYSVAVKLQIALENVKKKKINKEGTSTICPHSSFTLSWKRILHSPEMNWIRFITSTWTGFCSCSGWWRAGEHSAGTGRTFSFSSQEPVLALCAQVAAASLVGRGESTCQFQALKDPRWGRLLV